MKLTDEQGLLAPFCSSDEFCPQLLKPFYQADLNAVVATDTHNLIIGDKDLFLYDYKVLKDPLKIARILPEEEFIGTITLDLLEKISQEVPTTRKTKCGECDGDGKVLATYYSTKGYTYEIDGDCPICDGKGTVYGEEHKEESAIVRLLFKYDAIDMRYKTLVILSSTMKELQVEKARVLSAKDHKLYVKLLPKLKALFMGASYDEYEKIAVTVQTY